MHLELPLSLRSLGWLAFSLPVLDLLHPEPILPSRSYNRLGFTLSASGMTCTGSYFFGARRHPIGLGAPYCAALVALTPLS